jgi:hypothetical protein
MSLRRLMILIIAISTIGVIGSASAGNYIVYLHGRSMNGWPSNALLGAPSGWSHVTMSYNGSASLADGSVRGSVTDTIATYCGGSNQCVVVCYSAGCARMFDAYKVLKDQGRYPANILWSEAAGSAAGGSELATYATKWWVKLLAKIFNFDSAAPIDYDIQPNVMRFGTYANIQNQATTPVYHLAGSRNICVTLKILFIKVKLCGNGRFPGNHGDGAVPVHSAAGYADAGAHASSQDGGAKYVFRAYEQTPLYPVDHVGILGPLVSAASLRLAVNKNATCNNAPDVDPAIPDASIIYDDGDGAFAEESSPLAMVALCGDDLWNGTPPLYSTCFSTAGCCTDFSSGSAGGCRCGETLCRQAKVAYRSYYANAGCTGTEYADGTSTSGFVSYDGVGMVGENTASVWVGYARTFDGRCNQLLEKVTWGGHCPEYHGTQKLLSAARVVYRPAGAPPPPTDEGPGLVIKSTSRTGQCP